MLQIKNQLIAQSGHNLMYNEILDEDVIDVLDTYADVDNLKISWLDDCPYATGSYLHDEVRSNLFKIGSKPSDENMRVCM